jgi:hypothetical protein
VRQQAGTTRGGDFRDLFTTLLGRLGRPRSTS